LFKYSTLLHYHFHDAFYPQLAISLNVLPQLTFTAFCNLYKLLIISSTEYIEMEVMLKWFAEDKENKKNWPYPKALYPRGLYLNYFLEIGIIEVGICMLSLQDGNFGTKYSWNLNTWILLLRKYMFLKIVVLMHDCASTNLSWDALSTNDFMLFYFIFSDFTLLFIYFLFWRMMKRHMTMKSHDRSHDMMLQA